jgi:hypothetical protein
MAITVLLDETLDKPSVQRRPDGGPPHIPSFPDANRGGLWYGRVDSCESGVVVETGILTAIAKAIVGQAISHGTRTLTRRLMRRLRGDPVERAVADALAETLVELENKHPRAVDVLFDRTFLEGRGAAVLARFLVPVEEPTAEELVEIWSAQLPGTGRDLYRPREIVLAARDLLRSFDNALDRPVRQEVLRELRTYRAQRGMVDATSQLVAWADSQRHRALIDPRQRYDELDLDRFVGREWLAEQVDEFLRSRDSGYFVLEGAAGLGKSAFLASLARDHDYPVHFVRLARGRDDTAAALSNLAVQLTDRWEIEAPVSLHGPDVEPHEFYGLLSTIAQTRQHLGRHDPVVIVIDGLDEVRTQPQERGNVLGLPERPPDGVYFIVSQRPVPVTLSVASRWRCRLRTEPDANSGPAFGHCASSSPTVCPSGPGAPLFDTTFTSAADRRLTTSSIVTGVTFSTLTIASGTLTSRSADRSTDAR